MNVGQPRKGLQKVNIAVFLGQSMIETIIYDACDVFKESNSPPDYLSALYPTTLSCGQLGQRYTDYDCEDACHRDAAIESVVPPTQVGSGLLLLSSMVLRQNIVI